jgi:hypothetical protein
MISHLDLELSMASHASLSLGSYPYWHEHLSKIQREYDQASPKSLGQWWYDRRDSAKWVSAWVGVLVIFVVTVVFGIIQSVTGILQVQAANRLTK